MLTPSKSPSRSRQKKKKKKIDILGSADLDAVSSKKIRKQLEAELSVPCAPLLPLALIPRT